MASVKIYLNGVLVWSPAPGAANPPVTIKALRIPGTRSYLGFALIELQADQGSFFATVRPDLPGDGVLTLYGPAEDAKLTTEKRSPVGLVVSLSSLGEQLPAAASRFLSLDFSDDAGASLGSFKFQFTCQPVVQEALFRVAKGGLPELAAEPGRTTSQSFDIETLQPIANGVTYALQPWSPAGSAFAHGLQQSANRYGQPDGPIAEASYFGVTGAEESEVFLVIGTDAQGAEQRIAFISWLYDTPARGELRIVAADPDPQGADRGTESITLANVSSRSFSLARCYLEDEQPLALFGVRLNLPYGTPGRHVIPAGRLNPGDRLVVKPSFVLNNDFDAVTLRNRRGRKLDSFGYLRRLPGMPAPPSPRQRVVSRGTLSLTPAVQSDSLRLSTTLEDGDTVLIRPDPRSRLWAGELIHPPTGPEGWLLPNGQPAPTPPGWVLPLPGAPVYALLLAGRDPKLIGNVAQRIVIDRESKANTGLGAGMVAVALGRNDPGNGRAFAWGQFDVEVIVLRH